MDHSQPELETMLGQLRQAGIPREKVEALARAFLAGYEEYARTKYMSGAVDRLLAGMEKELGVKLNMLQRQMLGFQMKKALRQMDAETAKEE